MTISEEMKAQGCNRDGMTYAVEMPEQVENMELVNGRLFVTLEGGRVVDMTDWFAETPNA